MAPEILAFSSHCSATFQPILDCFIPNLKLKYKDSEDIKADRVNTVISDLHQIKCGAFFGTPGISVSFGDQKVTQFLNFMLTEVS